MCEQPADVPRTRKASPFEYGAARSGVCTESVIAAHFHEREVGPAFLGTYNVNQRLYILFEVGKHCGETGAGPDWARSTEGCVELEGDGDGSELLPEKGGSIGQVNFRFGIPFHVP